MMIPTAGLPRIWLAAFGWLRGHTQLLLRTAAALLIISLSALAAYTCHGRIGPPG